MKTKTDKPRAWYDHIKKLTCRADHMVLVTGGFHQIRKGDQFNYRLIPVDDEEYTTEEPEDYSRLQIYTAGTWADVESIDFD